MSFLLVTGKIFLCQNCEAKIQIEYEGGAILTQVGDKNVSQQIEYSKKFGQPHDDPEEDGFYLYDEDEDFYLYDFGICSKCYFETVFSKNKIREESNQKIIEGYQRIFNEKNKTLESLVDSIGKCIEKRISNFEIREMDKLIGETFDPDFGDKHALLSKKKRKLNKMFQEIRDKVKAYFISSVLNDELLGSSINSFNKSSLEKWADLVGSDRRKELSVFIPFDISQPENLNDYIQTENTVRRPIEETSKLDFYHQQDVSLNKLEENIVIKPKDIEEMINPDFILKSFKNRIEKMIIK